MPCQDLICDILMTIVNQHSHDTSSMRKDRLVEYSAGSKDHDVVRDAINELVNLLPFLKEWDNYRNPRIHLNQKTGRIVDYLVENCCEDPTWLYPSLDHVPNEKWEEHGVTVQ